MSRLFTLRRQTVAHTAHVQKCNRLEGHPELEPEDFQAVMAIAADLVSEIQIYAIAA
jgi:hypothetical protein